MKKFTIVLFGLFILIALPLAAMQKQVPSLKQLSFNAVKKKISYHAQSIIKETTPGDIGACIISSLPLENFELNFAKFEGVVFEPTLPAATRAAIIKRLSEATIIRLGNRLLALINSADAPLEVRVAAAQRVALTALESDITAAKLPTVLYNLPHGLVVALAERLEILQEFSTVLLLAKQGPLTDVLARIIAKNFDPKYFIQNGIDTAFPGDFLKFGNERLITQALIERYFAAINPAQGTINQWYAQQAYVTEKINQKPTTEEINNFRQSVSDELAHFYGRQNNKLIILKKKQEDGSRTFIDIPIIFSNLNVSHRSNPMGGRVFVLDRNSRFVAFDCYLSKPAFFPHYFQDHTFISIFDRNTNRTFCFQAKIDHIRCDMAEGLQFNDDCSQLKGVFFEIDDQLKESYITTTLTIPRAYLYGELSLKEICCILSAYHYLALDEKPLEQLPLLEQLYKRLDEYIADPALKDIHGKKLEMRIKQLKSINSDIDKLLQMGLSKDECTILLGTTCIALCKTTNPTMNADKYFNELTCDQENLYAIMEKILPIITDSLKEQKKPKDVVKSMLITKNHQFQLFERFFK